MFELRKYIFSTCAVSALLVGALLAFFTMETVGPAQADPTPRIMPIKSIPAGQSYGHWAAEWWQWALGVPAPTNPLFDLTGENCAQHQVGTTWFLAGFGFGGTANRNCTVPVGKGLFFPLTNFAYFGFLNDPAETRTEQFVREQARCTEAADLSVTIDGREFGNDQLQKFTTIVREEFVEDPGSQSPLFDVQLPEDNLFGLGEDVIPELLLSPSAEEGYYLYIRPLSPGEHTIRWVATGCFPGNVQDITYNLIIEASTS